MLRLVMIVSVVAAACTDSSDPVGPEVTSHSEVIEIPAPRMTLEAYCLSGPPIECDAWAGDHRLPECSEPRTGETCYRVFDAPQICSDGPRIEVFDAPAPPAPQTIATIECLL